MKRELFAYELPAGLIAQRPLERREDSRILVVDCETGAMEHRLFRDLPSLLEEGDCAVFNSSRVRKARLRGSRQGGGGAELLLLQPLGDGCWQALARPARRLRVGTTITFADGKLVGRVVEKGERGMLRVAMEAADGGSVEEWLERVGEVPLPPYIKERLEDQERYQTVYARALGSAAAPTAGLHFDHGVLRELEVRGVRLAFLELHVGLDTFRPIEEEEVERHRIHTEEIDVGEELCERVAETRREGRRVLAVGTTVVRALESAARGGELRPFKGPTDLYIYPGFRFRVVDHLLTNFHLPYSSLLVMVCAFAGRDLVMEAYRRAVEAEYRFLSFGDACLFRYPHGWRPPD
ncbi:MAG: tRNA preQ1(34) S-adenosylmethionine ribosyltransferase-isomerase QueA [Actinobacteria bacterium]|nr:tRNA preQ1(34) S-adenosylmethionine ribosyltransferase-isomerase QueA [Actinomycetota bacterium]